MKKIMYFMLKLCILGVLIFCFWHQNQAVNQQYAEIQKLDLKIDQVHQKLYISDPTSASQYKEGLKSRQELKGFYGDEAKLLIYTFLALVGVSLWIIFPIISRRKTLGKKTG